MRADLPWGPLDDDGEEASFDHEVCPTHHRFSLFIWPVLTIHASSTMTVLLHLLQRMMIMTMVTLMMMMMMKRKKKTRETSRASNAQTTRHSRTPVLSSFVTFCLTRKQCLCSFEFFSRCLGHFAHMITHGSHPSTSQSLTSSMMTIP